MNVSERVFDIGREVADLSTAAGAIEMIVHPTYENLFWRQQHEIFEGFTFFEQSDELLVLNEVDSSQQTNLHVTVVYSLVTIVCKN